MAEPLFLSFEGEQRWDFLSRWCLKREHVHCYRTELEIIPIETGVRLKRSLVRRCLFVLPLLGVIHAVLVGSGVFSISIIVFLFH